MDMATKEAISNYDLTGLAEIVRDGTISAEDLAAHLTDIALENAYLNAFVSLSGQLGSDAREADRIRHVQGPIGPLHGIPLSFKDNIDTRSMPTTGGTPALARHRPAKDAAVASALFGQGALLFGKNSMQELAFGVTCRVTPSGPVRNPYDLDAIPGGSSGGTAVAVATGIVPAGIGTDTGGSVRVPAALCGITALRPSVGRWPTEGILPISHTRDTPGPIARSVRDLALLDGLVTAEAVLDARTDLHGVRLGLPETYFWEGLDSEVETICEQAVHVLSRAGAEIIPVTLNDVARLNAAVSFVVALHEPRDDIEAYLRLSGSPLGYDEVMAQILSPDVRDIARSMEGEEARARANEYREVMAKRRPELLSLYRDLFARHELDALIFPTTPVPARHVDERNIVDIEGVSLPAFGTYIRNTDPGSNASLPGITMNAGFTAEGLPVGLAVDGPHGSDRRLLGLAVAIERALAGSLSGH